jgi:predicted PurR-regulated permease PerM
LVDGTGDQLPRDGDGGTDEPADEPAGEPIGAPAAGKTGDPFADPWRLIRVGALLALGAAAVLAAVKMLIILQALIVQVVVALFIAISLDPVVRWMITRRVRRTQAVAVTWFFVALLLVGVVYFAVTPLARQGAALGSDFPRYLGDLRAHSAAIRHVLQRFGLGNRLDQIAKDLPGIIAKDAFNAGRSLLSTLVEILLVTVLSIYFMLDLPRLRRAIVRLFPARHRRAAGFGATVVMDKVGAYMLGNIVISLIAGVAAVVPMLIMNVPFAVPLAIIVAITDLIPLVGATIGAGICIIVAAATADTWLPAVVLLIFFLVYQQVENYLIAPRVLRNAVDVPAVAVLLAALMGASVLGLVGALMAIPVVAAAKAYLGDRHQRLRGQPEDGEP